MTTASPFHRGESLVQERLGVREQIEPWASKVVRPYLPDPHREFYGELPYLVIAARDAQGRPWASLVGREPGFAHSRDPGSLTVSALPAPGDALEGALEPGADLGILGIELATRRRNRVNGRVSQRDAEGFSLEVEQSFGNCPQYIHERRWRRAPEGVRPEAPQVHDRLTPALGRFVEGADTFFIASGHRGEGSDPAFGMDASHRGGAAGFVRVAGPRTLLFPDYSGNNHFNTLGNLMLDPRAGLLFLDFERGDSLQLTGRAYVEWDHPELASFPGARRIVRFELGEAVELRAALPLRFDASGDFVRELRLVDKVPESEDVTSFYLEPRDGGPITDFAAGQHLPIEIEIPGDPAAARRTYSLSSAPGRDRYRITVKRDPHGLVSRHLHDRFEVGDFLSAREPAGDFRLDHEGDRPIVLVSAGVGVTPMLSMLHELAEAAGTRPVWFVHGARDGRHHPLAAEVEELVDSAPHARRHVVYSRPLEEDAEGRDYQSRGRVDAMLLEKLVPELDADYYLCGPTSFMAEVQGALEARGVAPERIHSETFGPAS